MDGISGVEAVKAAVVDGRTGDRGSGRAGKTVVADGALFVHFALRYSEIDNQCRVYSCLG